MANFNGTILTQAGRNLLAKALTGAKLEFTKVQLGDGIWDSNTNPETLTSLISPKIDLPINDIQIIGDGTVKLRVLLTNTGLTEGFFTRELGIFAKDPNTGEEVLYAVAYAENPDFIPSDGVTKVESVFDVYTVVANAQNVTAVISDTVVLATKQDIEQSIETHNQDTASHPDIRQKLDELQNQIDNIGEGITPDIQNAINQHNQDPNAHEDIRATLVKTLQFWKKEPRNPTPDDIPPAENALWLNTETGEIFVHIKTCSNGAVWKGQFGTLVAPSTVAKFDIFEDGSTVALYRFDGNAYDDGGRYNGTWHGNEQYDSGKFGQAAKFDGNSYIETTFVPSIPSSFSVWFKVTDLPSDGYRTIFCGKYGTDTGNDWIIAVGHNSNGTYLFFNGGWTDTFAYTPIELGVWYHYTLIVPDDNIKNSLFYLNCIRIPSTVKYNNYKLNFANLTGSLIGKGVIKPSGTFYERGIFKGSIDHFRIFNRALTEEEIQILYKEMEEC